MGAKPKKITLVRSEAMLVIEWEGGERTRYPLAGLRAACPCAECRQKRDDEAKMPSSNALDLQLQSSRSTDVGDIEMVGNYALRLIWDDGHAFGIYSWDYLKGLPTGESAKDDPS